MYQGPPLTEVLDGHPGSPLKGKFAVVQNQAKDSLASERIATKQDNYIPCLVTHHCNSIHYIPDFLQYRYIAREFVLERRRRVRVTLVELGQHEGALYALGTLMMGSMKYIINH